MMNEIIPFLDLKKQYLSIKDEIDTAVLRVLDSSTYVLGPEVEKFEEEFAAHQGVQNSIAVNSGTSALHLALLAAGVGPGDEVITVSMTFIATAAAISYTGAIPVFVDIDNSTFTMDPSKIEAKITSRTKVILPVHLYGHAADMDPIMEIAKQYQLIVIEDAAQAHGTEYRNKRVGGIGNMGAFSFYPGKNLGGYGEGGIVTTNSTYYANQIKLLRDWGQEKKYHHKIIAYNYRMDAIQGAILRVKLRHLETWTELRRLHAANYELCLRKLGIRRSLEQARSRHVYHIYSVFHPDRQQLQEALQTERIFTGMHYPIPIHLQKSYKNLGYSNGDFPITEKTAKEQLSLPMFAELTQEQVKRVAHIINKWGEQKNFE